MEPAPSRDVLQRGSPTNHLEPAAFRNVDLVEAVAVCDELLQRHADRDPLAMALQDPGLRRDAAPLYAFARVAAMMARSAAPIDQRLAALAAWDDGLTDAYHGKATHPIFVALRDVVRRRDIPITTLRDLLHAMRTDASSPGFSTFEGLLAYCRAAAGSGARVLVHLGGQATPERLARADDMGVALCLVDLVVDLEDDARAGRVLVPTAELASFGVTPRDLARPAADPATHELVMFLAARALTWLARARPLIRSVDGPLRETLVTAHAHAENTLRGILVGIPLVSSR